MVALCNLGRVLVDFGRRFGSWWYTEAEGLIWAILLKLSKHLWHVYPDCIVAAREKYTMYQAVMDTRGMILMLGLALSLGNGGALDVTSESGKSYCESFAKAPTPYELLI